MSRAFFDSNVLVYAFSDDDRALPARAVLKLGGNVSVQVLNELANVTRRKMRFTWPEVHSALQVIRSRCGPPLPVTDELHRAGLSLSERYMLSIYDGLIVAAALKLDCDLLWSEDMQHGMVIDGKLRIINPFLPTR